MLDDIFMSKVFFKQVLKGQAIYTWHLVSYKSIVRSLVVVIAVRVDFAINVSTSQQLLQTL